MAKGMKEDYLSVVYDAECIPYTTYPKKLADYLVKEYKLSEGMKMLEIGCGRGEFLNGFKQNGLDVFGIDISQQSKRINKNIDIDIDICNVEKEEMPHSDNTFDFVFSKSLIEHLSSPDHFLNECYRVLKPGGQILTLVPDWESNYKIYFDDYTHIRPYTIISLRDAYKVAGFKNISVGKLRQLPLNWKYPVLNVVSFLVAPFVPIRAKNKFLRWSRELMIIGHGYK